ncbi:hypothetical protein TYRP_017531 [Tyrophagus putrescentiae]|nr:hypothetical protein TYRP_017531 [Tyrophagus putrescentiae]
MGVRSATGYRKKVLVVVLDEVPAEVPVVVTSNPTLFNCNMPVVDKTVIQMSTMNKQRYFCISKIVNTALSSSSSSSSCSSYTITGNSVFASP